MKQTKVQELKGKIERLNKRIEKLQAECKHPKRSLTVKHRGSTGGWDADTYWDEITCRKCDKFWTEDR